MRSISLVTMELEKIETDNSEMFEMYRELIRHFYICMDVHSAQGNVNGMKVLVDYLFPVLDDAPKEVQFPVSDDDIIRMMLSSEHENVVLDEDDGIYKKGNKFKSFHHQAHQPMSRKALLSAPIDLAKEICSSISSA